MAKKLAKSLGKSKTKMSTFTKSVFTCQDCGTENEVLNSDVAPSACDQCGLDDLKLTAKMEISSQVTVVQLPIPKG